jgi:arginine exporter protein ArgO
MAQSDSNTPGWIYALQVASVAVMWVFVLGISGWILHLNRLSQRLNDVPSATVAISIVAIPVFITGASVLTYVFVGLQRGAREANEEREAGA